MRSSIMAHCCWLALRAVPALALTIAPYHLDFHGSAAGIVASSAQAKPGGNSGNGGGSGNGNGGNGNNGGGNNGNAGGNNGNAGGNNGNAGGNGNNGAGNNGKGKGANSSGKHVNATTGDRVEIDDNKIVVQHPNGFGEEIEKGRFKMTDALGRTIVERPATAADISRLKGL
ncbi:MULTISPECIES: hypothetical protein [unclassified Mesorhizobium]|uniref:hypothetical protein n=1 Tax=unclassified Mesorhizobium TaxID=325217 RepID=UPI001126D8C9|nr:MULTISPECIES: hypothetical protein [unclassified Mesorhizobium]MBZ9979718.1 hypothetical protein [Mesorhizobium sp. BR-1-1-8]MBZ9960401.1 hypothetical protein [Mesorhizobium sp. BR1-1-14]TPL38145.1 hypothetical protein FJ947_07040 [Mesorhizobium sp. B2-4-8]TPL57710.1 hypothetical protein FJ942_11730 [Mesorhizobium sp. B2-4-2]TPL69615.1 hypothetical protein FJ949_01765 [Mesorhizobium sp. B2-4-1]